MEIVVVDNKVFLKFNKQFGLGYIVEKREKGEVTHWVYQKSMLTLLIVLLLLVYCNNRGIDTLSLIASCYA